MKEDVELQQHHVPSAQCKPWNYNSSLNLSDLTVSNRALTQHNVWPGAPISHHLTVLLFHWSVEGERRGRDFFLKSCIARIWQLSHICHNMKHDLDAARLIERPSLWRLVLIQQGYSKSVWPCWTSPSFFVQFLLYYSAQYTKARNA